MATLASDVMERSRAVLNDIAIRLYSNTVLLPYLKIANDDLSDELVDNGSTVQKEVTSDIALTANTTPVTLPDDFITPIEVFEKNVGESDDYYRLMTHVDFLPNKVASINLDVWTWREQSIKVLGATQNKLIRVRYNRLILSITGNSSPIELTHALNYLAYHTAALAAEHIGQNRQKAIDLEMIANEKLGKLIKKEVKQNQATPTRRRAFRINRNTVSTR